MTTGENIGIIFLYLPWRGEKVIDIQGVFFKKKNLRNLAAPLLGILIALAISITLIALKVKTVTVVIDGKETKYTTSKGTVREVLQEMGITVGERDKSEPPLDSRVNEGSRINYIRAFNIRISADEREYETKSSEKTIGDMLKSEGITLEGEDRVQPEISESLSEGLRVEVIRVERKTLTEKVEVKFREVVKEDRSLRNTQRQVRSEGRNGIKEITTEVVLENGKEVSRKVLKETVVRAPVDKVIRQGTYPYMPVSRGGTILPYTRVFKSRATAYWAVRGIGSTYTASGRKAVRNPDGYSTIAVDPSVIPYGTKLFVEGYGYAIAADTGTAIKGEKIDVYFDTKREALDWAVKYVNVYILK